MKKLFNWLNLLSLNILFSSPAYANGFDRIIQKMLDGNVKGVVGEEFSFSRTTIWILIASCFIAVGMIGLASQVSQDLGGVQLGGGSGEKSMMTMAGVGVAAGMAGTRIAKGGYKWGKAKFGKGNTAADGSALQSGRGASSNQFEGENSENKNDAPSSSEAQQSNPKPTGTQETGKPSKQDSTETTPTMGSPDSTSGGQPDGGIIPAGTETILGNNETSGTEEKDKKGGLGTLLGENKEENGNDADNGKKKKGDGLLKKTAKDFATVATIAGLTSDANIAGVAARQFTGEKGENATSNPIASLANDAKKAIDQTVAAVSESANEKLNKMPENRVKPPETIAPENRVQIKKIEMPK